MSDIFEQYDVYKGDLDTSDPYNLAAIKQAEGKALAQAGESFVGGVASGYAGLPGELENLGRGGAKLYGQGQQNMIKVFGALADQVGIDGISKAVNTLFGSEQNKSAMEALLQGLNEETVLPTTEEIQNWLKEKGLSFDNEGAALIGEILAPASYGIKYGKGLVKSMTEGLDSAKKSFSMPDTLYHGTNAKFDKFDKSKSPNGLYFTDSPQQARQFGENVMDVEVSMKNPFIVDSYRFSSGILEDLKIFKGKIKSKLGLGYDDTIKSNASTIQPRTEEMLKKQGYDGIFIPKEAGILNENVYVPFDASQIKIKGK